MPLLLCRRSAAARSLALAVLTAAHATESSPLALLALVLNLQNLEQGPGSRLLDGKLNGFERRLPPKRWKAFDTLQLVKDLLKASVNQG
jgi:hypothetical protein